MTTAQTHFGDGDLDAAIAAVADELRREPSNAGKRAFFCELLCLQGDLEKADRQLDTLLSLQPKAALTVGTWRQLIRAAQARVDVFANGHVPDVVESPTERIQALLGILLALREGRDGDAAEQARRLEESRAPFPAAVDGRTVDDVRDLDDTCAGILEVLASNGKYFWVDFEQIASLELHAPERPLDLLWRRARLVLTSGTDGEVFVPVIYATPTEDAEAKLGRRTDWVDDGGLVRGVGHRAFLVGDEAVPLSELSVLDRVGARQAAV